jgi:predicted nucleic-acid-binding protein
VIGVDTNVLVRLFIVDQDKQHRRARRFFDERTPTDPCFVSMVTLVEFFWVLMHVYGLSQSAVLDLVEGLLMSEDVVFESVSRVRAATNVARETGADFEDALVAHSGQDAGVVSTVTFDRKAAKRVSGMELLA